MSTMEKRLAAGLDPLTGERMETEGVIAWRDGVLCDETGRAVRLNKRGTWAYADEAAR